MAIKEIKMLLHRPALTNEQIQSLKSDIKLLARHVSNAANLLKKIPVTKAYNAIAEEMGYSSFSQLSLNKKSPIAVTAKLDLLNDIEVKEVYSAFKCFDVNLDAAETGLKSAQASRNPTANEILFISLSKASEILNRSYVAESQHVYPEVSPKEFKATLDDEFFKDLSVEDSFVMDAPDGKKYYYTVVDSSPHIYDESVQVLTIRIGLWVALDNGGFSVGAEYKG